MKKLLLLFVILFLIGCNENKVYKTYDTIKEDDNTDLSINSNPIVSGTQEEKIATAKLIIEGASGFELFASELGWETNENINITGDPNAIKGDTLRFVAGTVFPNNFRTIGKDSRSQFSGQLEYMIYETLMQFDSETFQMQPALATHWKMLEDSLTYKFRINPKAKFSDGKEVTAFDVVASFNLMADEGHGDPNVSTYWNERFEIPVAESKYIISFKAKRKEWRLIYSLGGIAVYPAYYLDKINGEQFIEKYQFDFMPGSGPYKLDKNRTTQDNNGLVVLEKRKNYWAENEPRNTGKWNFNTVEFLFINDETQEVVRFFNGDYDTYQVSRAQWWNQKFTSDEYPLIERGLIQRKKFINFQPMGLGGIAFNSLEEPFNDIRVREAFCHLWDVATLQDKLFFNEYVRKNSYFPNTKYEHPDNPIQDFRPEYAIKLLNEAGWIKKPGDKWLTNNKGEIFEIEKFPIYQGWDRIFNRFVADLEDVGVKLNLVVMQNPFEEAMERKFKIYFGGWVGSLLPSPEGSMHSKFARQPESSNYTGIENTKIDSLIELYNSEWDIDERIEILQTLDSIATREYYWIFGWGAPYGYRCLNWDKFGMPDHGVGYSGDWLQPIEYWWIDPEKKANINNALINQSISIPIENETIDHWNILKK